jgi:hypothetical protein
VFDGGNWNDLAGKGPAGLPPGAGVAALHNPTVRPELYSASLSNNDILIGANLSSTNLSRTNLIGVNLSGANLSGAWLTMF